MDWIILKSGVCFNFIRGSGKEQKNILLYMLMIQLIQEIEIDFLNVIKDYVDKSQLVVVDANTQYTSLLKTWRNNISVNKPVFPFVGSSYFDNGVKVCTYYGTRERVKYPLKEQQPTALLL